ncbi:hypothetical protein [Algivirga pacifica]|uniref:Uncharacterized protein n=1 Tax=Algivirga pacifica TaxID=1162670 RepID=A0ABP9DP45_9BACT
MTNKLITLFSPFLFLFLCSASCEDFPPENPDLPAITAEGENTFGCIIADTVWVPCCSQWIGAGYQPKLFTTESEHFFHISAQQVGHSEIYLTLLKEDLSIGESLLLDKKEDRINNSKVVVWTDYKSSHPSYTTEILRVQLSRMDSILAGTFEFDAVNGVGDTIQVRDGRFDLRVHD